MMNTSLTGLMVASKDLSTVSNNLANASTNGFKRSMAQFQDVMASTSATRPEVEVGSGALVGEVKRVTAQGALVMTEQALDISIVGGGYFVYGEPGAANNASESNHSFSRAGKLQMDKTGQLVDMTGAPLLGFKALSGKVFGGTPQPINVIAAAGGDPSKISSISISQSGMVSVAKADGTLVNVASIAMANFRNENGLRQSGNNKLTVGETSGAAELATAGREGLGNIQQGALEATNVDITQELLHMVSAQQAYNGNSRALQTSSEMLRSAIETLAHS